MMKHINMIAGHTINYEYITSGGLYHYTHHIIYAKCSECDAQLNYYYACSYECANSYKTSNSSVQIKEHTRKCINCNGYNKSLGCSTCSSTRKYNMHRM